MTPNHQDQSSPRPTGTADMGALTSLPLATAIHQTKPSTNLPSLPILSAFLFSHFQHLSPLATASEVPWLYHSPLPYRPQNRNQAPRPLPAHSRVQKLVLSITPTEGVYTALGATPLPPPINKPLSGEATGLAPARATMPPPPLHSKEKSTTAAFIHRPWTLNRGRLPRGMTVWASHKAFDESLTVGCNLPLLQRLGVDVEGATLLVGYKGDEGRRIGAVAGCGKVGGEDVEEVRRRVVREFGDVEGWFGFGNESDGEMEDSKTSGITAIACMNAFHPPEVDWVAAAAVEAGFATSLEGCSGVLYLTGGVREKGIEAALQKGMRVACVGHQVCEAWGIGFLAEKVREKWPNMLVEVIDEEELKPLPVVKKAKLLPKPKKDKERDDVVEEKRMMRAEKRRKMEDKATSEDDEECGGAML